MTTANDKYTDALKRYNAGAAKSKSVALNDKKKAIPDYQEALQLFKDAQAQNAKNPDPKLTALFPEAFKESYNAYGSLLIDLARNELSAPDKISGLQDAIAALREGKAEGFDVNDNLRAAYHSLGNCHKDAKDFQDALDAYNEANAIKSASFIWHNIAICHIGLLDNNTAKDALKNAIDATDVLTTLNSYAHLIILEEQAPSGATTLKDACTNAINFIKSLPDDQIRSLGVDSINDAKAICSRAVLHNMLDQKAIGDIISIYAAKVADATKVAVDTQEFLVILKDKAFHLWRIDGDHDSCVKLLVNLQSSDIDNLIHRGLDSVWMSDNPLEVVPTELQGHGPDYTLNDFGL